MAQEKNSHAHQALFAFCDLAFRIELKAVLSVFWMVGVDSAVDLGSCFCVSCFAELRYDRSELCESTSCCFVQWCL